MCEGSYIIKLEYYPNEKIIVYSSKEEYKFENQNKSFTTCQGVINIIWIIYL